MSWKVKNQSISYMKNKVFIDMTIQYSDDVTGELIAIRPISASCSETNPNIKDKLLADLYKLGDDVKNEILKQSQQKVDLGDLTTDVEVHLQGA